MPEHSQAPSHKYSLVQIGSDMYVHSHTTSILQFFMTIYTPVNFSLIIEAVSSEMTEESKETK